MSSSPVGQDILAQWSSSRGAVMLSSSCEFAPLAASADSSSCIAEEGCAPQADMPLHSLQQMDRKSQDLPLRVKLEQLRKWQLHMQEQLKAHQLEELLNLQEEQQRNLGIENDGRQHAKRWDEETGSTEPERRSTNKDERGEETWSSEESEEPNASRFPEEGETMMQPGAGVRDEDESGDDRPIRPGVGGQKQTFEELLEEQLRLEEEKLKSTQRPQDQNGDASRPKRNFLKRGEGLSRFTNKPKVSSHTETKRIPPEPTAIPSPGVPKGVRRKTASLTRATKAQPGSPRSLHSKAAFPRPEPRDGKKLRSRTPIPRRRSDPLEMSFQEKLRRWECERQMESLELGEFEMLEEAAEEMSFSSNSSFVLKVLQMDEQKRQQAVSGLHQKRLSSTPIKTATRETPGDNPPGNNPPGDDPPGGSASADPGGGGVPGGSEYPAPYDQRPYQDDWSDSSSTLTEDGGGEEGERARLLFDDDDTWNDAPADAPVEGPGGDARGQTPPPERTPQRKAEDAQDPPPPPSQLMEKFFPTLKPKPPPAAAPPTPPPGEETAQQLQSKQLREKLIELEIEIERFKKENAALSKLREENEKKREDLRRERADFEQTKARQLSAFEDFKREENRKLQKERKLFEKHAAAARAVPDKKEREEIQLLKQQLTSLLEDVKKKESRWASTNARLRQQVDSVTQENNSLRDEIRMLEKLRLSALKKTSSEKETQTKERTSENAATKGVTFASPLDSRAGSPPASSNRRSADAAPGIKSSLRRSAGSGRKAEETQEDSNSSAPQKSNGSGEDAEPITHSDGRVEKVLASGERLLVYPNGTRKEVSADGMSVKVSFFNGDTKQVTADRREIYYYAKARTTHITYPDGLEVLHFPSGQTEKHFPDGRKEITFANQTVKNLFPDGREESVLNDGTIVQVHPDGTEHIHFVTGQKEIHTPGYKRREYPDGTVKTVYPDGRQETRYPTGRLRVKDGEGNVLQDSWT